MAFQSINPATEEVVFRHERTASSEIERKLSGLESSARVWSQSTIADRQSILNSLAQKLIGNKDDFARLMALEMGKPLAQGSAEIEKCAWVCRYYSEHIAEFMRDTMVKSDASRSYVTFQPMGTIFAIMPWNFPFWQTFRFAAPAIAAGNTILLKHAPSVFECAKAVASLFDNEGFALLENVICDHDKAAKIIGDPRISAVTFTGSTKGGSAVGQIAGRHLKKTVLELGGSDPYIIMADCDIKSAAEACVTARLINTGQSCIAAKRILVQDTVYDAFISASLELLHEKTYGDPMAGDFDLGPLARNDLRSTLHNQVQSSTKRGAKLELGGFAPNMRGFYYPPTLIRDVEPGMAVFDEETFGPVLCVSRCEDFDDAVQLANQSQYGLGACVFSSDKTMAEHVAKQKIQAGAVFVNDFVRSDPRLPFGGLKQSGYGRELSLFGFREFVNVKTIWIK